VDFATVRWILEAVAKGTAQRLERSCQLDAAEMKSAVFWLKQRVWIARPDKGSSPEYQPAVQEAAKAAQLAVRSYENGDLESATVYATEALKLWR